MEFTDLVRDLMCEGIAEVRRVADALDRLAGDAFRERLEAAEEGFEMYEAIQGIVNDQAYDGRTTVDCVQWLHDEVARLNRERDVMLRNLAATRLMGEREAVEGLARWTRILVEMGRNGQTPSTEQLGSANSYLVAVENAAARPEAESEEVSRCVCIGCGHVHPYQGSEPAGAIAEAESEEQADG